MRKKPKQSIMVLWLLPQNPTLHFALRKEQSLQLKDFSRAWIGMVVATIGENVSHTGQNSLLPMRLFIPNPSFRTSFRSLITCRAVQIHTFHSLAPMVVLINLRTGMARRKLDWGYRLKGKRKDKSDSCTKFDRWIIAYSESTAFQMLKIGRRSKIYGVSFFCLGKFLYFWSQIMTIFVKDSLSLFV